MLIVDYNTKSGHIWIPKSWQKIHDPHDIQEIQRRPEAKLTTGQNVVGQLHPEIIRETKKHSRSEGSIFQLTGNKAVVSPNLNNTFPVGRSAKVGRRTQTASGPHYQSPTEHQSADLRSSPGDGQWQNSGETLREVQPRAGRRVGSLSYGCSESVQLYGYGSGSGLTVSTDWRL